LSYEVIRFAARRRDSLLAVVARRACGCSASRQAARDDQAAVAIHALEGAMALEKSQGGELVIG